MTEWGDEMCPECLSFSVYRRSSSDTEYRCGKCGHEFDADDRGGQRDGGGRVQCGICPRPAQYRAWGRASHVARCLEHAPWRVSV